MNDLITQPAGAIALPDNGQWELRFEIRSASSNRIYIVARNKKSKRFGCSCPGYKRWRKCKHLTQGCHLELFQIHGNAALPPPKKHKAIRYAS